MSTILQPRSGDTQGVVYNESVARTRTGASHHDKVELSVVCALHAGQARGRVTGATRCDLPAQGVVAANSTRPSTSPIVARSRSTTDTQTSWSTAGVARFNPEASTSAAGPRCARSAEPFQDERSTATRSATKMGSSTRPWFINWRIPQQYDDPSCELHRLRQHGEGTRAFSATSPMPVPARCRA